VRRSADGPVFARVRGLWGRAQCCCRHGSCCVRLTTGGLASSLVWGVEWCVFAGVSGGRDSHSGLCAGRRGPIPMHAAETVLCVMFTCWFLGRRSGNSAVSLKGSWHEHRLSPGGQAVLVLGFVGWGRRRWMAWLRWVTGWHLAALCACLDVSCSSTLLWRECCLSYS